jgi:hypothetical protein
MPSNDFQIIAFATFALCAGPILFLRGFRDFRIRRLIQNTPTARIRSMAMGLAEIHGAVAQRSALHAPFSGRPCAYWSVDISVRRRRNGWGVVHRQASGNPFYVEDETGAALVYPHGSDCKVNVTSEEQCLGISLPECYTQYMSEKKLHFRHVWRLSAMRFRERILEEGQPVYVLGSAEPRAQSVTLSDGEELQATGTDGPPARQPTRGGRRPRREHAAVIRRGAHEPVFIISQDSERAIVASMGLSGMVKLALGPVLTVTGLWIWSLALTSSTAIR